GAGDRRFRGVRVHDVPVVVALRRRGSRPDHHVRGCRAPRGHWRRRVSAASVAGIASRCEPGWPALAGPRYTLAMLTLDRAHAALLAMDCQSGIVSQYVKPAEEFLGRASKVLTSARAAGVPVIHVRVGFRPGLPEIGDRNKLFAAVKASPQYQKLFDSPA